MNTSTTTAAVVATILTLSVQAGEPLQIYRVPIATAQIQILDLAFTVNYGSFSMLADPQRGPSWIAYGIPPQNLYGEITFASSDGIFSPISASKSIEFSDYSATLSSTRISAVANASSSGVGTAGGIVGASSTGSQEMQLGFRQNLLLAPNSSLSLSFTAHLGADVFGEAVSTAFAYARLQTFLDGDFVSPSACSGFAMVGSSRYSCDGFGSSVSPTTTYSYSRTIASGSSPYLTSLFFRTDVIAVGVATVPEPSTLLLFACGVAALLKRLRVALRPNPHGGLTTRSTGPIAACGQRPAISF